MNPVFQFATNFARGDRLEWDTMGQKRFGGGGVLHQMVCRKSQTYDYFPGFFTRKLMSLKRNFSFHYKSCISADTFFTFLFSIFLNSIVTNSV